MAPSIFLLGTNPVQGENEAPENRGASQRE